MRNKGFDVPDTGLTPDQFANATDAFNSAVNACMEEVSSLVGEENDLTNDPHARELLTKGTQCLRDLGYDVPDPGQNGVVDVRNVPSEAVHKCFGSVGGNK